MQNVLTDILRKFMSQNPVDEYPNASSDPYLNFLNIVHETQFLEFCCWGRDLNQ